MFSQNGALTDIDIKRNSQGKSRKFAFIGFHNERDADEAIRTFNHTFIKTNKIQVERCLHLSAGKNFFCSSKNVESNSVTFQLKKEEKHYHQCQRHKQRELKKR